MTARQLAEDLRRLHTDPELLVLVNVWDVVSARTVAALPGTTAIATASYAVAAAHGYPDGEQIPLASVIETLERIVAAVELPVTADLEAGYGDVETTVRRAIGVGVVGGNIEDAMRPRDEAVTMMAAAVRAGEQEGVPFVLNARTDAFLRGADDPLSEAIERGRAFLDVGATCVFVPGVTDADTIRALVDGIGERKVSVMGTPASPPPAALASLGIARVSHGPWLQQVALAALARAGADLLAGEGLGELQWPPGVISPVS